MRTLSSLLRRHVVTQDGRKLGRCYDLRGELSRSSLKVTGLVVGRRGLIEHFGIGHKTSARRRDSAAIPWEAVIRIEGKRIVVRDDAETT